MAIYKSKFTGEEIDEILTNVSNVTNIEANPSGEATEELTKITIGDTTYSIPDSTDVTIVEGNPSGEATVELTKLKIGDTIYSIPQGGGEVTLGHTITTAGVVTKVYFADGTTQSNPSGVTFSNVIAVDFYVLSTSSNGTVSTPLGIKSYSTYSTYANDTFTTGLVSYTTGTTVYVRFFPFADGTITLQATGGAT